MSEVIDYNQLDDEVLRDQDARLQELRWDLVEQLRDVELSIAAIRNVLQERRAA